MDDQCLDLPPGFRFHPTDAEVISHYLSPKVLNHGAFSAAAVGEVDLNKCEPWDLPRKAKMGEKEWYFFCQRDRKYPTGMRTNRATESGYWKATGKDKEIHAANGALIGMKKTLVFYKGRAPKGEKTDWVMHEFRLENKLSSSDLPKPPKDEWVVSKVFEKNSGLKKSLLLGDANSHVRISSTNELIYSPTLPPLMDPSYLNSGAVDVDSFKIREIMANSAPPNGYYYSAFSEAGDSSCPSNQLASTYNPLNPCNPPATPSSTYFHQTSTLNYRSEERAALAMRGGQCNTEQFSSHSMLSQDTGEPGTEISSVISKINSASCGAYGRDGGGGGAMDFANMWRC